MSRVYYGFIALLCFGVAGYAAIYWLPESVTGISAPLQNRLAAPALPLHAGFGGLALAIGWMQFIPGMRGKRPRLHHAVGRIYVLACLVSGAAGLTLAAGSYAGPLAQSGFGLLGLLWIATTLIGVRAAIGRRFDSHRAWMFRSFALTFAAVTLRFQLPLSQMAGYDFEVAFPIIAWACWVPNLIVAELWLAITRGRGARLAAA
jgi:uncharacterized membrane protein